MTGNNMTNKKRIIACLDLKDGRLVKGVKFEGLRDIGEPLGFAKRYYEEGANELAFLDISSTDKSRAALLDLVRNARLAVNIPICVGGGISTVGEMEILIRAGADKVSVCSSALARPELLSEVAKAYGSKSVMLAIDAKRVTGTGETPRWNVFAAGGRTDTGLDAVEWAKRAVELGAGEIMLNSIDADGTGAGYDLELCTAVASAVSVPVIASGGAGSLEQIAGVLLNTPVDAALVASFLHYGKSTVREIKEYLLSQGISVEVLKGKN